MSLFSVNRLLLGQINDSVDTANPYFTDSTATDVPIVDSNINDNRYENSQRLEIFPLFDDTESIADKFDELPGIYQISLFVPSNEGIGKAFRLLSEIKSRYPRIVEGTPNLNVTSVSPGSPFVEGRFYRSDISVNYYFIEETQVR